MHEIYIYIHLKIILYPYIHKHELKKKHTNIVHKKGIYII